jgi:hypothetical protein
MSVLSKLASLQGRRDEEPNKDLGRELVERKDLAGIREIVENLRNKDPQIQADCLAVLEEVGQSAPELIEDYISEFLRFISSKNNRLVWSAMIDLALIADRKPQEIYAQYENLVRVIESGSVITQDNGIKILAKVASTNAEYREVIFPFLMEQLKNCRSKSLPQYAESIRAAVTAENQEQYRKILEQRYETLSPAQQKRVMKLLGTL